MFFYFKNSYPKNIATKFITYFQNCNFEGAINNN